MHHRHELETRGPDIAPISSFVGGVRICHGCRGFGLPVMLIK